MCIPKPGKKRNSWISLKTTDKLEALRRLERTGVSGVIETAQDERFAERVVEVLTTYTKIPIEKVVAEWLADEKMRLRDTSMVHHKVISSQLIRMFRPGTSITSLKPDQLNNWVNTAPSLTRRHRRMMIIASLFQFAFDQGYRKDNPGKRLVLRKEDLTFDQMERKIKEEFTLEEFQQFMACDKIQGFWRWAIQLSWWLGLRMSDCCMLQWGSFCAVPGKLVVWQVKTRRRIELDLSDPLLGGGIIPSIIEEMKSQVSDAVFCFPEMRDLYRAHQSQTVLIFRECCKVAGLDGKKTFHCFRKSAAKRWQEAGRSIKEIGALLGHEGTGATEFYLETNKR